MFEQKTTAQTQKPNIIFMLGDDIGYKTLAVNGGKSYSTPNLDSMARHGMNFTQCHASPLCSPSRFMLLTGKYNFRNYTEWGNMDTSQKTIGNMFKDAGYKTACFGKWQLNGGDQSIHKFGFDNYCVTNPITNTSTARYKNPHIYTTGAFVPDNLNAGKYGEDIFSDSVMNFIERNKTVPFFVYYPMGLAHAPFQPTPDDADFATWNSISLSDTVYYSSMIKYMDKKIGQIINKVKELGIENNTVIIYVGDNGTPTDISQYIDDDSLITGGKSTTTEFGTHVPLIIYWPGTIAAGAINNDIIDFTDFLPALANIANIPKPTNYGTLDGVSFAPRLTGGQGTPRDWIFYHYDHHPGTSKLKRWAQTVNYKLYDTSAYNSNRLFYNIKNDINEKNPIPDNLLTSDETAIKQQLLNAINSYVAQGIPLFSNPVLSSITDSSVVMNDTIVINGGSTISVSGAVWSTSPNPIISSSHTSNGKSLGPFSSSITGLTANTTYYVRAYAINNAGVSYSNQASFKTLLHAPVAIAATFIDSNKFTANWNTVSNVSSYRLDVSTFPTFSYIKSLTLTEGFNNGITPSVGWTFSGNIIVNNTSFGKLTPSVVFNASKAQIITKSLGGFATQLKFWIKAGANINSSSSLLVEGFNGSAWVVLKKFTNLSTTSVTKTINASSTPPLPTNISQFRFTYTKSLGTLAFDDVSVNYNASTPSFVSGFNNLTVKGVSQLVTGLKAGTNYYYRIRAINSTNTSGNSNVITSSTCNKPVITNLIVKNITCNGNNNGSVDVTVTGVTGSLAYNWTGANNFTSSNEDINNLTAGVYHLTVSNAVCAADTSVTINDPVALDASANAGTIACAGGTTALTISATGGTGNYHYTLSDGTTSTGPQNENQFIVAAGNYTVLVKDDNNCSFTTASIQVNDPVAINAAASADPIACTGGTTTLTVNATGGTGNYQYTLSDGTNTTGPQNENQFTVAAGNYTVLVEDDNHCSDSKTLAIDDGIDACLAADQTKTEQINNLRTQEKSKIKKIAVFPNPSSGEFNLSIETNGIEKIKITVIDMYGKKVYQAAGSRDKYKFGGQFISGIYILHIQQGNVVKTFKLIKVK